MFSFFGSLFAAEQVRDRRRRTLRPRLEVLESRRCMAGEVVSLHVNARTADDRPLTDEFTREATVEVGDLFYLEVSYEDLRPWTETRAPGGAFQLLSDLRISSESGLEPVLLDSQLLKISSEFGSARNAQITVRQEGNPNSVAISFIDFFNRGTSRLTEAMISFGYSPDQFRVLNLTRSVAVGSPPPEIILLINFTDIALGDIDQPGIFLEIKDAVDVNGVSLPVTTSTIQTPFYLPDGSVNRSAVVNGFDYRSRTFPENEPFYDLVRYGRYARDFGYRGVGGLGQIFGSLSAVYPDGFPAPFDFLSIPVRATQPRDAIRIAVTPSNDPESVLLYPYGRDLPPVYSPDDVLLGSFSQVTISAQPADLTVVGNLRFFTSETPDGQRELFVTEGDFASARLVRDLNGTQSSDPEQLTAFGNELYFSALMPSGERELYRTDGTRAGTRFVRNVSDATSSEPQQLTAVGDQLYFTAIRTDGNRELYVTQSDPATLRAVKNLSGPIDADPRELTAIGDTLYFTAITFSGERELYSTDGTAAGTKIVRNLSGLEGSDPKELTRVGDQIFFTALTESGKRELHVTDGTALGTRLVRDYRRSTSSDPRDLTAVGNLLAFTALRSTGERELFRSDGTFEGTVLVKNLRSGMNANPHDLQATENGISFFIDGDYRTRDLYFSDLTKNGTVRVNPIDSPTASRVSVTRMAEVSKANSASIRPSDSNADGKVTAADALAIINALSRKTDDGRDAEELEDDYLDANRDGRVSASDALMVINHMLTNSLGFNDVDDELEESDKANSDVAMHETKLF